VLRSQATAWLLVAAVLVGAVATAAGAFIYGSADLKSRNAHLADRASLAVNAALSHEAFYLEDVADMVGVHDDADVQEFSRYARVRNGTDSSVLLVRWLRRSPSGKLLPPHDAGPRPVLLDRPALRGLAQAERNATQAKARVVAAATSSRHPAVSAPIRLREVRGVLVAVPVRPHQDSGLLSKFESKSVVVGLLDVNQLVQNALTQVGIDAPVAVSDDGRPLQQRDTADWTRRGFVFGQRQWQVSVEPLRRSTLVSVLPWFVLAAGTLLAAALALLFRTLQSGGARAVRLADRRGSELAQSLAMTKRIAEAIEERFYTYELLPDGGRRTLLMTGGWKMDEHSEAIENWDEHVHPDDREVWRRAADAIREGRPVDVEFRLSAAGDERWIWARERPLGIVNGKRLVDGVASDVTKRKRAEIALAAAVGDMQTANQELIEAHAAADRRSRTDALTGAFNRRHFTELLEGVLNPRQPTEQLAVLLVDIDHFKSINDQHGHLAGDAALREITQRISTALHPADRLARWGGDEFVILGGESLTSAELLAKAQALVTAVGAEPLTFDGAALLHPTASVGVALVSSDQRTADEVIGIADAALYEAKRLGRNRVAVARSPHVLQAVA
jgi:diguanylate cyclase (GGDEF)-like protein